LVQRQHDTLPQIAEFSAFQYRQMLLSVEQALALDPLLLAVVLPDQLACNDLLRRRADNHPFISAMLAISRDGTVRCASAGQGLGINLSDRAYFRDALATDRFVVGEPVVARPVPRLVAPVALRLAGVDPVRGGGMEPVVIAAALALDGFVSRLQELAGGLGLAAASRNLVRIVDARGVVMSDPLMPDRRGSVAPFWHEGSSEGEQRAVGRDFDGRDIALAISRQLPGGLFVVVAAPIDAITVEANRRLWGSVMVALASLLAGLGLAFLVVRRLILQPLGSLTEAAHVLKSGASDISLSSHRFIGELADLQREPDPVPWTLGWVTRPWAWPQARVGGVVRVG